MRTTTTKAHHKGSRGAVLKCQEPLAIRWQRCQPALWLRRPSLDPVAAPHHAARGMCSEAAGQAVGETH